MANNNKHTGPNVPALRFPEFSGEWETKCLGDISENISSGKTKSTTTVGKYVLIGSTGVIGNTSDADYSGNLILVARVGANAGLINYYSGDCGITDNTLIIKPREQEKNFCHYVYHYLKHCNLNQFVFGSGQPLITGGMLKRLPIRYGTTDEINKLSSLFDLLDARIEAQSKIIEELKTLRSALVDTFINDGNNNTENQTIMSLGAYGCFVRGLTYSSVDVTDNTASTGVVRSNNIEYGSPVDIKADLVYVTKKPSPEQMLVNGDIVICMANGSSSLVGKASNYQELCRNMTVGAFCGIYRGTHPLTKWIFMSSAYCKAVANAIQGGNGAIANLHAEDILSMCFAVPSDYKTITELGKLMSLFDEKLHAAEEQLARFIEQKKYFLFKMFI